MNAVPPRLDISDPTVAEESNQEESVAIKEPSALKEPAAEESTGDEQPASINTTTTPEVTAVPQIPGPAGDTPPPLAAEGTHDHSSSTPLNDSHQSPPSSPENDHPSLSLPAPNPEEQDRASPSPGSPVASQQMDNASPTPSLLPTSNTITTPSNANQTAANPVPPKVFASFDGLPKFITSSAVEYLEKVPGGEGWTNMIKSYLRLEQLPTPQGVSTLLLSPGAALNLNPVRCPPPG